MCYLWQAGLRGTWSKFFKPKAIEPFLGLFPTWKQRQNLGSDTGWVESKSFPERKKQPTGFRLCILLVHGMELDNSVEINWPAFPDYLTLCYRNMTLNCLCFLSLFIHFRNQLLKKKAKVLLWPLSFGGMEEMYQLKQHDDFHKWFPKYVRDFCWSHTGSGLRGSLGVNQKLHCQQLQWLWRAPL